MILSHIKSKKLWASAGTMKNCWCYSGFIITKQVTMTFKSILWKRKSEILFSIPLTFEKKDTDFVSVIYF